MRDVLKICCGYENPKNVLVNPNLGHEKRQHVFTVHIVSQAPHYPLDHDNFCNNALVSFTSLFWGLIDE